MVDSLMATRKLEMTLKEGEWWINGRVPIQYDPAIFRSQSDAHPLELALLLRCIVRKQSTNFDNIEVVLHAHWTMEFWYAAVKCFESECFLFAVHQMHVAGTFWVPITVALYIVQLCMYRTVADAAGHETCMIIAGKHWWGLMYGTYHAQSMYFLGFVCYLRCYIFICREWYSTFSQYFLKEIQTRLRTAVASSLLWRNT